MITRLDKYKGYKEALREYEIAENHFNYAEEEYIDKAILSLARAEENLMKFKSDGVIN